VDVEPRPLEPIALEADEPDEPPLLDVADEAPPLVVADWTEAPLPPVPPGDVFPP